MTLKFTKTRNVTSPSRANPTDAGMDFFIPQDFPNTTLEHGDSVLIPAGIKVDVPEGWALIFFNKSGIASKKKLDVGACVVDHGYKGEVHINLHNVGCEPCTISPGDKIIQGVLLRVGSQQAKECAVEEMWLETNSVRGEGGFGSTGTS